MFLIHTPRDHAETVARAVVGACRLDGWGSPVQPQLLHTLFNRLLGQDLDFEKLSPLGPSDVANVLRTQAERDELIQLMTVMEILCNPLSPRRAIGGPVGARAPRARALALLRARSCPRRGQEGRARFLPAQLGR